MSVKDKHILLITSTNLACNPRSLKELQALNSLGVKITVVAFNLYNWTTEKEIKIKRSFSNVEFIYLDTTKHSFFSWLFSSLVEKISSKLMRFFPSNIFLAAMAINKRSWILLRWSRKWKNKANLIIAHNPPAFYTAYALAQKQGIPFALDIEDYHPGEGHNKNGHKAIAVLMQSLFKKASYISYASPLIKVYTEQLIEKKYTPFLCQPFVINNVFAKDDFHSPDNQTTGKMKIVWFSQNIDKDRGLEEFIPAIEEFEKEVELTLIGNSKEPFIKKNIDGKKNIKIIPSLDQHELYHKIGDYDIGLAIEPGKDINNGIALSNKIWAYFQAGLFICASNTEAQSKFIETFPGHGIITSLKKDDIVFTINFLLKELENIREQKIARFIQAKNYCWEKESKLLVDKWEEILL